MVFELSDEIEQIIDDIEEPDAPESRAINKLFELMKENKHIVYAKRNLLIKLKDFKYINFDNKKYIDQILQQYIDIYSSIRNIKKRMLVVPNNLSESNDWIIELKKCSKLTRAKLSADNPDDAEFYISVFSYMNTNKLYTVNFENSSFCGSNAERYLNAMDEELNIILAISDSDKEYENCDLGNTAKKVINAVNNAKNAIMEYYIIGVREIENLIPIDFYSLISNSNVDLLLDCIKNFSQNEEFMKYVNIKDGVSNYCLDNADEKWHKLYDDFIQMCKENGIYNRKEDGYRSKICVKGIGSNQINRIRVKLFKKDNQLNFEILGTNYDRKDCMPQYIINEWSNIYNYLLNYGCALKPAHNSFL